MGGHQDAGAASGIPSRIQSAVMISVLSLALVSGCTLLTPAASPGGGVVIEGFSPVFSSVRSGEPVTFRLSIRNTGSSEARQVHAELLGLDQDWCKGSGCDTSRGGSPEKLPEEAECQYTGSGFALDPPTSYGGAGETHECTWNYNAPMVGRGLKVSYDATARVFYTYRSTAVESIPIGSVAEARRLQDSGLALPAETVSSSSAPIQISIESQSPIRAWEDSVTFPVKVTIQNTGGGVACASESGDLKDSCKKFSGGQVNEGYDAMVNNVRLAISGTNLGLSPDCSEFSSGRLVSLTAGSSNSFVCQVTANAVSSGVQERTIVVTADYEYALDGRTSVTVAGQ
jgi:hypothetical protein